MDTGVRVSCASHRHGCGVREPRSDREEGRVLVDGFATRDVGYVVFVNRLVDMLVEVLVRSCLARGMSSLVGIVESLGRLANVIKIPFSTLDSLVGTERDLLDRFFNIADGLVGVLVDEYVGIVNGLVGIVKSLASRLANCDNGFMVTIECLVNTVKSFVCWLAK